LIWLKGALVLFDVNIFRFLLLEFLTNIEIEVLATFLWAGFRSELIVDPLELRDLSFGFNSIVSPELDLAFHFLDFDLDFDFLLVSI